MVQIRHLYPSHSWKKYALQVKEIEVTVRYSRVLEKLIVAPNVWSSYINAGAQVVAPFASSVTGPYAGSTTAAGDKIVMDIALSYLSGSARDNLRNEYDSMMQTCE